MNDYQNIYILLCVIIIYSCIRINTTGFIYILAFTFLIIFIDEKNNNLEYTTIKNNKDTYAMLSKDMINKVTLNPRKINKSKNYFRKEPEKPDVYRADTNRDKKPSPYQHSYEQRKRLLEGVFLDLENTNKWKTISHNECNPIRGKSSFKI